MASETTVASRGIFYVQNALTNKEIKTRSISKSNGNQTGKMS